jgi:hypothetical protein
VGENRGPSRGGEFVGDINLAKGDAAEDFGGGGSGEREFPMSALDRAGSLHGRGGGDFADPEVMDAGGGTDEIDDGVHGAHLVEVDGLDRDAVELGFGLGDTPEHGQGGIAHFRGEGGFFEEIMDFRPVAAVMVAMVVMMVVVPGFFHEEAGAGQAATDGALGLEDDFFRKVEGGDGLLKEGEGYAQIEESGAKHVTADAGRAAEVKVGRRHRKRID